MPVGVGELVLGGGHHGGLGPDPGEGSHPAGLQLPNCYRQQVGGDGHLHPAPPPPPLCESQNNSTACYWGNTGQARDSKPRSAMAGAEAAGAEGVRLHVYWRLPPGVYQTSPWGSWPGVQPPALRGTQEVPPRPSFRISPRCAANQRTL